jgi:hypothetical protein
MLPCPHCGEPQGLDSDKCDSCGKTLKTSGPDSNPFGTLNADNIQLVPQSPFAREAGEDSVAPPQSTGPQSTGPQSTGPQSTGPPGGDDSASPFGTMMPGALGSPLTPTTAEPGGGGSTIQALPTGAATSDDRSSQSIPSILGDVPESSADLNRLLPGMDSTPTPMSTIQLPMNPPAMVAGPPVPADIASVRTAGSGSTVIEGAITNEPVVGGSQTWTDASPGQVDDGQEGDGQVEFKEEQTPGSRFAQLLQSVDAQNQNALASLKIDGDSKSVGTLPAVPRRVVSVPGRTKSGTADYELLEEIGSGAMGTIYSARQKGVDRTVALKTIKDGVEHSDENVEKFLYEAQITGDLDHPNIVPIHELGANEDGALFYSMKLVKGTPWQDVMSDRAIDENLDILMKVADALSFAHSRGVIHRDLKPDNVMLGDYGEVLLMDWGLAVNLNKQPHFGFGGTPAYMAPEMAYHLVPQIGFTSDVYLLGAVLYQIVNGCPPHPGESAQSCLQAAANNEMVPVARQDGLTALALRAMATHPQQRFDSVALFQDELRQYRRHAESVTMTRRAQEALEVAMRDGDYDSFSRAIFGFQDAKDLWPENQAAVQGQAVSRLEFGRRALDDNNLQLAIRVLDPNIPEEAELAAEAKKRLKAEGVKDRRMKILRTSFAVVILISCAGLSVLWLFADGKRAEAEQAQKDAVIARNNEAKKVIVARELTIKVKEQNTTLTDRQRDLDAALAKEKDALGKEKKTNTENVMLIDDLKVERTNLTKAKDEIQIAQRRAESNLADALNGTYQSQLGLVFAQLQNADLGRASSTLTSITGPTGIQQQWLEQADAAAKAGEDATIEPIAPDLSNWVYRRATLLTNQDLLSVDMQTAVVTAAFSQNNQVAAIVRADQTIDFYQRPSDSEQLVILKDASVPMDSPILAIDLSGDGRDVACLVRTNNQNQIYAWRVGERPTTALTDTAVSQISFTANGRELWALLGNGIPGIRQWTRTTDGVNAASTDDKQGIPVSGAQMMAVGRDQTRRVFVYTPSKSTTSNIQLFSTAFKFPAGLPWDLASKSASQITAMSVEPSGQHFLLGFDDGTILRCKFPASAAGENPAVNIDDLAPTPLASNPHFSAIHTIAYSLDGTTMLTGSRQSDLHLWTLDEVEDEWVPTQTLLGHSASIAAAAITPDGSRGISVDVDGRILEWDFHEQQRRTREELTPGFDPTVHIVRRGQEFLSFDSQGLLRRNTTKQTGADGRPEYFGHTPGVDIYAVSATPNRERVATAAQLQAPNDYALAEPVVEICLWDTSGAFLARLHIPNSENAPEISLSADGSHVGVAGSPTVVWNVDSQKEVWRGLTDNGDALKTMSIKLSPTDPYVAFVPRASIRIENYLTGEIVSEPLQGASREHECAFAPDGKHLFILFEAGDVGRRPLSNLNGEKLDSDVNAKIRVAPKSYRRHVVVQDDGNGGHRVYVVHHAKSKFETVFASLTFGKDTVQANGGDTFPGWRQIGANGNPSDYSPTIGQASKQMLASPAIPILVDGSNVSEIGVNGVRGRSFARTPCANVSSDSTGQRIVSLHSNGSAWLWQVGADKSTWTPFRPNNRFSSVSVSPDGQFLLTSEQAKTVGDTPSYRVWNVDRQQEVLPLPNSNHCWLVEGSLLATADESGDVHLVDPADKSTTKLNLRLPAGTTEIIPFTERLRVPLESRQYLISRRLTDGVPELTWLPLKPAPAAAPGDAAPGAIEKKADELFRLQVPNLVKLTTSPSEGLLVTGTSEGSTTVWFCSPSIDKKEPREMLNLRGHMGAQLTCIQFDSEGNALMTADDKLRNFVWHSSIE